jgi:hypothetical protein
VSPLSIFKLFIAVFSIVFSTKSLGQEQVSVNIKITNNQQKPVSFASVTIGKQKLKADSLGAVNTTLPAGNYIIDVTAVNHIPFSKYMPIIKDTLITIITTVRTSLLNMATVRASRNVATNQMGVQTLTGDQLRKLPVLLGEADPLKAITLLPGIKSGGEASAGIYVRGGGPDQNLILLDGVNVYNPNHLLGFFSVFNGDAIKSIEVIKAGFPAEYGGRLSSVINITSRDGNMEKLITQGSIGLISTKLSIEGPIQKNKSSFIVSARRTYIDQVVRPFAREQIGGNGYFFYDINAKATWRLNKKNVLSFNFFNGKDDFTFSNDNNGRNRQFNTNWGNTISALNWDQKLSKKLEQRTSLIYNRFGLDSRFGFSTISFLFTSGLQDYQVKSDWTLKQTDWLSIKWGGQLIRHTFRPGAGGVTAGVQEFKTQINNQYANEAAAYVSTDVNITPSINLIAGLRYSYFNQVGPTSQVVYDADGFPTGQTVNYARGERIAQYHYPEPRLSMRWKINEQQSIKASYARTIQYLQLATTSGATFPSDLWVPASQRLKPGKANQVSIGYFKNIKNGVYEFSAEAYYKTLTNQLEFRPGAQLLLNANLEAEMIFGTGKAYGIELFFQKKVGRLTGWVGYTLSRAERKFAELNNGKAFPFRYDRTHDLSIVGNYKINKKWNFSSVFVYGTGNAITLPNGRFTYNLSYNVGQNQPIFTNIDLYGAVNDFRMPAYHRLDVNFTYTPKPDSKKRYQSSWNFGVYNLYNRYNPFFIYLDADADTQSIQGKKVFLFPIIPSATWNFKF